MGRRALRKPDPNLDLSSHFNTLEEVLPLGAVDKLFDRPAELEVEVGSGKGLFLSAAASQEPDRNFLGIELAVKYAEHAASRIAKRDLTNARMVQGDALRLFAECIPDNSLAAVHVYFPDPWWKARHKKRRVMNERFVRDVQRVLKPGGTLHFWTDVQEYFESALEVLKAETSLDGPIPVAERPADHDLDYRTHFERRMRMHGKDVFRSRFLKPSG